MPPGLAFFSEALSFRMTFFSFPRHPRESGDPCRVSPRRAMAIKGRRKRCATIPALPHGKAAWTPAFAGVTGMGISSLLPPLWGKVGWG